MKNNLIYSVIFISLFVFIGSFFIYSQITNSAQLIGIRQGGTATGTIAANDVLFGSSKGVFMTQDNNFSYATTTDTLTITNASTTNMTISTWLNSSTDRLPNAYFTNLDSTNATIGTLTLTSQIASGDLLVNGQGKFGTTATTTISGNSGTSAFSGRLTVDSTTATSTFSTGGLTVGTNQFVVQQTSGNIGIGTTGPGYKLTVEGTGASAANVFAVRNNEASSAYAPYLIVNTGDGAADYQVDRTGFDGYVLALGTKGGAGNYKSLAAVGRVVLATEQGNVGIGTTSPVSKLSVVGESAFAGGASVGIGYAGTAAPTGGMIIQGNVGIGTTAPASLFHVSAGASATTTVEFGGQSTSAKTCFNVRDNLGAATSFYFSGTTMIVEANRCK